MNLCYSSKKDKFSFRVFNSHCCAGCFQLLWGLTIHTYYMFVENIRSYSPLKIIRNNANRHSAPQGDSVRLWFQRFQDECCEFQPDLNEYHHCNVTTKQQIYDLFHEDMVQQGHNEDSIADLRTFVPFGIMNFPSFFCQGTAV